MGGSVSNLIDRYVYRKQYYLTILGLEAAGKTSLLYRLKTGAFIQCDQTTSYNTDKLYYNYSEFLIADMAGEEKYHGLWRHYYCSANGIVFVVDASDKEKVFAAADKFNNILSTFNTNHVLILANKQDLDNCLNEEEIINIFRLRESSNINWRVQPASVKEWYGVNEGFEWLSKEMSK